MAVNNSPQSVNLSGSGQNAAFTFQGSQGDYLSLQLSSFTSSNNSLSYSIYDPTNTPVPGGSGTVSPTSASVHLPRLALGGTYSVFFGSGSGTDQFSVTLEKNQNLVVDGSVGNFSAATGQTKRFLFAGTASDNFGLGIGGLVGVSANVVVYKPDGSQWTGLLCSVSNGGCDLNLNAAPVAGLYSVVVAPSAAGTMSFTATVSHDVVVPLAVGTPASVSLSRNGQNGRVTFSGTAGAAVGVQGVVSATNPSGRAVNVTVLKPDGTTLTSGGTGAAYGGYALQIPSLPTTGTYTIFFDPQYGATVNVTATLITGDAGGGSVPVDGASQNVSGNTYTYSGFLATAGDNIGIGISNLLRQGSSSFSYQLIYVYAPDGSQLVSGTKCFVASGGCDVNLANLPTTGLYGLMVESPNPGSEPNLTQSFTATVSHDVVAPLAVGTPASVSLSRNGQNGRVTFSGTAGAAVGVQMELSGVTPSGLGVNVTVLKPDGTTLNPPRPDTAYGGYALQIPSLPTTGTYTIFFDPQVGATVTETATLITGGSGGGSVPVDGASQNVSGNTYAYSGFLASAGDNIGIGISNLLTQGSSSSSYQEVWVYAPDGHQLVSGTRCFVAIGGCDVNLANLPATGLYGVVLVSPSPSTEQNLTQSFTVTVSHDVVVPLTMGTPASVSLSRNGQNGRLTFSGTAGAAVGVQMALSGVTPSGRGVNVMVLKPDGTQLSPPGTGTAYGGYALQIPSLPTTGTYTIFFDPQVGTTVTVTATLITGGSGGGSVPVDGASQNVSGNTYAYSGFVASAGDNIGIGISNLLRQGSSSSSYQEVWVYAPDGRTLVSGAQCFVAIGGCDVNLTNLPATGLYGVVLVSPSPSTEQNLTQSFTVTVSHDVVAPLTVGTPAGVSLSRNGQNGRVTFSGTVGAAITLQIAGISTVPSGQSVSLTVYKPDGSTQSSGSASSSYTFSLTNLPSTGTYVLFIDPQYGSTASAQVTYH